MKLQHQFDSGLARQWLLLGLALWSLTVCAGGDQTGEKRSEKSPVERSADSKPTERQALPEVIVKADPGNVIGISDSANEGHVSAAQIANRPLLRPAELLEIVPGLIVTQHSGSGKANQYFLRGFNLDHGTDLSASLMGMPLNMPTHAHGQGYLDLNFLIPELVSGMHYKKGTYYAQAGDFSAAGTVAINYVDSLPEGIASVTFGQNDYRRLLVADSFALGSPGKDSGTLLAAFEGEMQDGPWVLPEAERKLNGVLRYTRSMSAGEHWGVTFMAYRNRWHSTDQIPQRAVANGQLDRLGTIDPSDGGNTSRISLSADWSRVTERGRWRANVYAIDYRLQLFSNFTYFQNDPVRGDQFEQLDRRKVFGFAVDHLWTDNWAHIDVENEIGLQTRHDRIGGLGLYLTEQRNRFDTIRADQVEQTSISLYASNTAHWTPWLRTIAGIRADQYWFQVNSKLPENAGHTSAFLASPKFSVILTPTENLELYANVGRGFHSNDARGTTLTRDPASGLPAQKVNPLVGALGKELGIRVNGLVPGLQTSLSAWQLDSDSELLFVGDAGATEASRPSRRRGIEVANSYTARPGVRIDLDLAWSRARFRNADPAGDHIPGAIERTASLGIQMEHGAWSGGLRVRYFGPRALVEDGSVISASSTLAHLTLGYQLSPRLRLFAEVLNLFNRQVNDIEYFYASQLQGETAPVEDRHFHPAEPRTVRVGMLATF